jgi:hypothetical protein
MATVTSFNRRRTQATKVAWVVVPPHDESTGLPDLPLLSCEGQKITADNISTYLAEG